MFKRLPFALALLALAGCDATPPPAARDADPALWVVRDEDTTIYLFGTVHLLRPGIDWFDDGVKSAFDASGQLVLELVPPSDAQTAQIVRDLGIDATGPTLSSQLPPETAHKLHEALIALDRPPDALDRNEPWLAAITLAATPSRDRGYAVENGAEAVLRGAAAKSGKTVLGLETMREQLGFFDTLSPGAQRQLLEQVLDGLPDTNDTLDQVIADWSRGDADALARLLNEDLKDSPELAERLLYARNRRWADWIAKRMQQPGTIFVAVGAGHLAGARSVQRELAARGLKAARVAD